MSHGKTGPRIISFSSSGGQIIQSDLMEERILFQRALRSVERWQEKSTQIRSMIEAGASIEPGIYKARVIEIEWRTVLGFVLPVKKLEVS